MAEHKKVEEHTPRSRSNLSTPIIEWGRILNVNYEDFTVNFAAEMSQTFYSDVPFAYPYFDQKGGSGITYIPEVGQTGFILIGSDGKKAVFAFLGADEKGSYHCGQPRGNSGDIVISGRDGNFVKIGRGGYVQIGSTAICQTVYLPIRNIIRQFAENYELFTIGGDLTFEVKRAEDSSDGESPCLFQIHVKDKAKDKDPLVTLQMGHVDDNNALALLIKSDSTSLDLKITKKGAVSWYINDKLDFSAKKAISITSKESSIKLKASTSLDMTADSSFSLDAPSGKIHSKTQLELQSDGTIAVSGTTKFNNGTFPVILGTPEFLKWITVVGAAAMTIAGEAGRPPALFVAPRILASTF